MHVCLLLTFSFFFLFSIRKWKHACRIACMGTQVNFELEYQKKKSGGYGVVTAEPVGETAPLMGWGSHFALGVSWKKRGSLFITSHPLYLRPACCPHSQLDLLLVFVSPLLVTRNISVLFILHVYFPPLFLPLFYLRRGRRGGLLTQYSCISSKDRLKELSRRQKMCYTISNLIA
jgi:hypothetical protein